MLNLFFKSTHCPFNFAAKGGLKKKEKKTRITRCVIVACRQTKIKRFDKRRRSVLEGVKRFIWSTFDPCQNILIRVLSRRQLMSSLISWLAIWTWLMRGTLLFFCVRRERICQEAHKSVNNYGNDHFPIKCWDMTWHFPAKERLTVIISCIIQRFTHTHTHTPYEGVCISFFFFFLREWPSGSCRPGFRFLWISPQPQSVQPSFLWCIQRWIIYGRIKAFVVES